MTEPNIDLSLLDHYSDSLNIFNTKNIVGLWLQGSQNYGMATETSDVDTKLLVTPTLYDLATNKKPVSTTYIRKNNEHIDFKDVREYIQLFRKQNINFLEILFTDYYIVNGYYEEQWNRLIKYREEISRMNPVRNVKSMYGVAAQKYHALEHPYESKKEILKNYGYDPKQLHHLLRIEDFMKRYIEGEPYEKCLKPIEREWLIDVKKGYYNLDEARVLADKTMKHIEQMKNDFEFGLREKEDEIIKKLLEDVQYNIVKISIQNEVEQ